MKTKILEYWHISRTALAGMVEVPTRWDRMQYVKKCLLEYDFDLVCENCTPYASTDTAKYSNKKLWLTISEHTS